MPSADGEARIVALSIPDGSAKTIVLDEAVSGEVTALLFLSTIADLWYNTPVLP